MIPSKLYISGNSGDDYNPSKKYFKGVNETSKESRKAAAKAAKRRKLDPVSAETTVEMKARMEAEKAASGSIVEKKKSDVSDPLPPGKSRIEALRAKLHAKIAARQGNRPAPEAVSKRAARRAEKNRRREEAAKRQKIAKSSAQTKAATSYKTMDSPAAVSHDLETLDFGRLAGLNDTPSNYAETNKALQNLSQSKNLHKLLADAEAKRLKLEALKKGSAEDKEKAAAMQWKDTFKEADGVRVKDNPAKLRKAIKRKVASKSKSQKAWKARTEQQQQTAKNRQKIRQHNLKARKQGGATGANLSKKEIDEQPAEGGRRLSRAGFEGRKQDFLNSPKEVNGKKGKQ